MSRLQFLNSRTEQTVHKFPAVRVPFNAVKRRQLRCSIGDMASSSAFVHAA